MPEPYVNAHPGDLITAQLFNGLQSTIKQDIADQIKKAVDALKTVDNSGDSAKLGGKTPKELEEEILKRCLEEIPKRTGYKMLFRRLRKDHEKVIEHCLKAFPLVDIYQLDYFPVICAAGDSKDDRKDAYVNFYLYHSNESQQTSVTPVPGTTPPKPPIFEIEPRGDRHPFKIPFATMLNLFAVSYSDTSSLDDLETEFWKAFLPPYPDQFEDDQYCHSPWFEKCCGEQRSVATLKARGDWNDIVFQMRPRKVVRFPTTPTDQERTLTASPFAGADIQVVHFDFDTIGVRLLSDPVYTADTATPKKPEINVKPNLSEEAQQELKVMLLLKV